MEKNSPDQKLFHALFGKAQPDEQSAVDVEMIKSKEFIVEIDKILKSLTEREEKVLKMRFGLGSGYENTLEEVAASFQVSRERIRQIEAVALRKIRADQKSKA